MSANKYLKDKQGNRINPITSTEAVKDSQGTSVQTLIDNLDLRTKAATDANRTAIQTEVNRAIAAEDELRALYQALTQTAVVPVAEADWPLATLEQNTVYRVAGTTSYTDYMYNGTSAVPMATYDNAIDDTPTIDSDNLVKSGGVALYAGAFNVSEYRKSASTLATFASLSEVLASAATNIPTAYRIPGMSIKFIQLTPATYTVVKTEGVTEQPTGTELQSASSVTSGTYNTGGLTDFATLPTTSAETYYFAVTETVDEQEVTTYTTWVITLVQSSDNKYVQFRYMGTSTAVADFTNVANWQSMNVDDEPTAGSENLVKSGRVYNAINLFSHPLANRVIKELYIPNVNYTAFTKISVWLCHLNNKKYYNIIRLFVSDEDYLYLYLKYFDTEAEALADMANNMNGLYESLGQYVILSVSQDLAGTNIVKEDFTINRDIANLNNSPVIKESLDKVLLEASIVGKEALTNKVSEWSQSPTDTHYPSEKLVHDTILTPLNSIFKTIESGSKNLYDYEYVGVLSGTIASKGYVTQTYNGFYTGKIPVEPNHYYYLSNRSNNVARAVRCLDANDNVMKVLAPSNGEEYDGYYLPNVDATGSASNGQFKTPANAAYIQINLTPLNVTEIGNYYQIMLEDVGDAYNPDFVSSEYEPYNYTTVVKDGSLQYPVKPLADKVKALVDNSTITVKLLCVGSSFTQDEFGYLPFILKSIAPNVKLTIGIAYIGGSPLPQHTAYLTHADSEHRIESDGTAYWVEDGVSKPYKRLHIDNSELTEYTGYVLYKSVNAEPWSSVGSMLIEDVLTNEDWDIVTYQGAAAQAFKSWDDYYAPYIFEIVKQVNAKVGNNVKLAFNLIHSGYATSDEEFLSRWLETAKNAKKVLQQTGISLLFPSGTAIQNIRCIDALRAMGDNDYHNLLADTAHLQDGIGTLCTAYANALTLLKALGIDYEGVIGEGTRPDAAWITDNNIPGPHIGSGVIGITDDYCLLAQIAATNAVKYPYSIINPSVSAPYTDRDTGNKLGISKDELSTDVQASLNKADSAITISVNNLVNYYLKSETYTKAEVDALIAQLTNRIATLESNN